MVSIRLHNTLSRQREVFIPADSQRVTLYVCGPTVYMQLLAAPDPAPQGVRAEAVEAALADDLNTPLALGCLHEAATALRKSTHPDEQSCLLATLRDGADLLGLLRQPPASWRQQAGAQADCSTVDTMTRLIAARHAARAARDFARADALRQELSALGIGIEDRAMGTTWHRLHAEATT